MLNINKIKCDIIVALFKKWNEFVFLCNQSLCICFILFRLLSVAVEPWWFFMQMGDSRMASAEDCNR